MKTELKTNFPQTHSTLTFLKMLSFYMHYKKEKETMFGSYLMHSVELSQHQYFPTVCWTQTFMLEIIKMNLKKDDFEANTD